MEHNNRGHSIIFIYLLILQVIQLQIKILDFHNITDQRTF